MARVRYIFLVSLIQFFQEIWRAIMMFQHENIVSKARQKYVFTSACILWKSTPNIGVATSQAQKRESSIAPSISRSRN